MRFRSPQTPGIGGLDEITDAEELILQNLAALGDPNADRILFWDDSAGAFEYLTVGSGLTITDTTLTASGATLDGSGTTNEIAYWVDSDTLGALAVATYPSLTELAYVKGVTSAIQTQIASKVADTGDSMTGLLTISLAGNALRLVNTTDGASVQVARFEGDRATMADDDAAYVSLMLSNDGGTQIEFGRITWVATDVNAGTSEDGAIDFGVMTAGTLVDHVRLNTTTFRPITNDSHALGAATQSWSDMFLADGGVLNWGNGGVTVTHTAASDSLTLALDAGNALASTTFTVAIDGANELQLTSAALVPASNDGLTLGSTTLGWSDLHLATGGVINWANGEVTITETDGNTLTVAGATLVDLGTSAAFATGTIELGHASDTTLSRVSAGVVAIEGSNIIKANTTATRTIVLTAAGGWPSTTAGCATNAKVETGTNDMNYYTLDFDQTTEENAEWSVVMPDSYDGGTITAIFYWTAAAGTGDVIWGIKGRAFANDDALDQAFGTAVTVTDTLIATGDLHVTSATAAVTFAGSPAGGQFVSIKCYRDADAGGDTLNADAKLMAVKIEYGINAYTD